MNKKFFGALVVVAIALGAMSNLNLNKVSNKGDLALTNIEALAYGEISNGSKSMMIVDQGTTSECINRYVCSVQTIDVLCFGIGDIPCTPGTVRRITPSNVQCGEV